MSALRTNTADPADTLHASFALENDTQRIVHEGVKENVAKRDLTEESLPDLGKKVAADLRKWGAVLQVFSGDVDRICSRLEEGLPHADASRQGAPSRDRKAFENLRSESTQRGDKLFYDGFRDLARTELQVLAGFAKETPTREGAFALFMVASALTEPETVVNADEFVQAAQNLHLNLSETQLASLHAQVTNFATNRATSFANYAEGVAAYLEHNPGADEFSAMRDIYHQKRRHVVSLIKELDPYFPWESANDEPWRTFEHVPGGWSDKWIDNFITSRGNISNPQSVVMRDRAGSFLFIPIYKEKRLTRDERLTEHFVRVTNDAGVERTERVLVFEETASVPVHSSGKGIGEAYKDEGQLLTSHLSELSGTYTNVVAATERYQQYEVATLINNQTLEKLKNAYPPLDSEVIQHVEWCLRQGEQFYLMPLKTKDKWSAIVISLAQRNNAMSSLAKSIKSFERHGLTYAKAKHDELQAQRDKREEMRVKQRIEEYAPVPEMYVQLERAGNYVDEALAEMIKGLDSESPEKRRLIVDIEAARINLRTMYGDLAFMYGKESYYRYLAIERLEQRISMGLVDKSILDNKGWWNATIAAEITRIHYEMTYKVMVYKNIASELSMILHERPDGKRGSIPEEYVYLRARNLDSILEIRWREMYYRLHKGMDSEKVDQLLVSYYALSMRSGLGYRPYDSTQISEALDLAVLTDSVSIQRVLDRSSQPVRVTIKETETIAPLANKALAIVENQPNIFPNDAIRNHWLTEARKRVEAYRSRGANSATVLKQEPPAPGTDDYEAFVHTFAGVLYQRYEALRQAGATSEITDNVSFGYLEVYTLSPEIQGTINWNLIARIRYENQGLSNEAYAAAAERLAQEFRNGNLDYRSRQMVWETYVTKQPYAEFAEQVNTIAPIEGEIVFHQGEVLSKVDLAKAKQAFDVTPPNYYIPPAAEVSSVLAQS